MILQTAFATEIINMKNYVDVLTGNHIINVGLICWFAAQALKIVYNFIRFRKIDLRLFFSSGSMPSSHSALVTGTATAVGIVAGWQSVEFGMAAVLASIVMYDASGVRRAVGEQAKILNFMMDNWDNLTPEMFKQDLKELIGHTPLEVATGAVLGIILALIV